MIKEFCAENFTDIPNAIQNGTDRIELCDNLAVGGTTPSFGVIRATIEYANETDTPVMTIIRPRGGNFAYNVAEFNIMLNDIAQAKQLGARGIVLGCLDADNWLDEPKLELLMDAAAEMEITFHMAFDEIAADRQFKAIDWLVDHGVSRILTHGGAKNTGITDNFQHLKDLIEYADNRITIMPGGGVNYENVNQVVNTLGVQEVHGTKIVKI
ncbi:copper homeostasis protein CutC [Paucilactobacillus nenjiangensis]|uniref:copper homeostasis protein CutC n=1 Tax=Paucilactobacillus nenjiangensis TaxID=1296540 RepID=UPI003FA251CA